MTEPQDQSPEFGEPTDVSVDPDSLEAADDADLPTSDASRYEEGDSQGGTGGRNAGGAG